jgi:hypothetical protein
MNEKEASAARGWGREAFSIFDKNCKMFDSIDEAIRSIRD